MPDFTVPALFDVDAAAGRKRCCTCKQAKFLAEYSRHTRSPLGLNRQCRPACGSCNLSKGAKWHGPAWAMTLIGSRLN